MKYLKAVVVGAIASVVAILFYLITLIVIYTRRYPGTEIGFDLRSMFVSWPSLWITPLAAFALGFWWVLRRASRNLNK